MLFETVVVISKTMLPTASYGFVPPPPPPPDFVGTCYAQKPAVWLHSQLRGHAPVGSGFGGSQGHAASLLVPCLDSSGGPAPGSFQDVKPDRQRRTHKEKLVDEVSRLGDAASCPMQYVIRKLHHA